MTPFVKVSLGIFLLIPSIVIAMCMLAIEWEHPELTDRQLFLTFGWSSVAIPLAVPGVMLIHTGVEENEEEE